MYAQPWAMATMVAQEGISTLSTYSRIMRTTRMMRNTPVIQAVTENSLRAVSTRFRRSGWIVWVAVMG